MEDRMVVVDVGGCVGVEDSTLQEHLHCKERRECKMGTVPSDQEEVVAVQKGGAIVVVVVVVAADVALVAWLVPFLAEDGVASHTTSNSSSAVVEDRVLQESAYYCRHAVVGDDMAGMEGNTHKGPYTVDLNLEQEGEDMDTCSEGGGSREEVDEVV